MSITLDELNNDGAVGTTRIVDPNVSAAMDDGIPTMEEEGIAETTEKEKHVIDINKMAPFPETQRIPSPLDNAMAALDRRTESIIEEGKIIEENEKINKEVEEMEKESSNDESDNSLNDFFADDTSESLDDVESDYQRDEAERKTAPVVHTETAKEELEEDDQTNVKIDFEELAKTGPDLGLDAKDFDDLFEDEESDDASKEDEEMMEHLRESITEKIVPISKKLNIENFKVVTGEPVSVNAVLEKCNTHEKIGDWVLNATKRPITMKTFNGTEIDTISNNSRSLSNLNSLKIVYKSFFDHIPEDKRPKTFEAWLKTTSYLDIDHLYMAAYNVSFDGANHIPYTCPKCKNMWITDNESIMEMVKFKNETVKNEWNKIRNCEYDPTTGLYASVIIPISPVLAFKFREPSIYDVVIEPSSLDTSFRSKYANVLSLIYYIDNIYFIDQTNGELKPVRYKEYPNNISKTFKSKILTYSKCIGTLSSDEYNTILAYLRGINEKDEDVTYVLPEVTCPKCGEVIPEEEQSAQNILFTRHQLTALLTI